MSTAEQQSDRLDADTDVQGKKGRSWLKIGVFYMCLRFANPATGMLNHHTQGNGARVPRLVGLIGYVLLIIAAGQLPPALKGIAGKPSTARARHLAEIAIPMLFLQGTRDALADPRLLADTFGAIALG